MIPCNPQVGCFLSSVFCLQGHCAPPSFLAQINEIQAMSGPRSPRGSDSCLPHPLHSPSLPSFTILAILTPVAPQLGSDPQMSSPPGSLSSEFTSQFTVLSVRSGPCLLPTHPGHSGRLPSLLTPYPAFAVHVPNWIRVCFL